jgi:hypothetical protein
MSTNKRAVWWMFGLVTLFVAALAIRAGQGSYLWRIYVLQEPMLDAPDQLDLGDRERGKVAELRFTVANKGRGKLVLREFESSCGCQVVEKADKDRFAALDVLEIMPEEKVDLVLRLAVGGQVGAALRHSVTFDSNDPQQPQVVIPVVVPHVLGGITALPGFVDFGTVVSGRGARQVIEIRDDAPVARSVDHVATTQPGQFKASFIPCKSLAAVQNHPAGVLLGHVEIEVRKQAAGLLSADLEVHLAADRPGPDRVPLLARVAPLVSASPATLLLPRLSENGELFFAECLVSTTDRSPLRLKLKGTHPYLTARLAALEDSPDKMILRVDWKGPLQSGAHARILLQACAGKDHVELEIPVRLERPGKDK